MTKIQYTTILAALFANLAGSISILDLIRGQGTPLIALLLWAIAACYAIAALLYVLCAAVRK